MGAKQILEEMYQLVSVKSEESIDERKFNNSILNSLKVKTVKERNAVLNELLIMLKSGNETIGKVSNGNFTCFPDIIEKTEERIIQRFETENAYKENKNVDDAVELESKENNNDNDNNINISDLVDRYADLDASEYGNLLENLGKLDDSQMETVLKCHEQEQEPLVEGGIKEQDEVEEENVQFKLMRAYQGDDADLKVIAEFMTTLGNKHIDPDSRRFCIIELEKRLSEIKMTEKVKKFCEEVGAFEIIERMHQDQEEFSREPTSSTGISREDVGAIADITMNEWKKNLLLDKELAQQVQAVNLVLNGNYREQREDLKKYFGAGDIFQMSAEERTQLYRQRRESKRFMISAESKERLERYTQNIARNKAERPDDGEQRTVKGPQKRPLRAVRNLSELGTHVNRGIFQNNFSRNNIPIKDFEMGNYFERFALPVNIPDFKSNIIRSGASDGTTKKPVIGEIIVESIKKMTTRMDGIRKLLASRASKGGIEEASTMLFDLAAEIDDARINDGDESLNNPTKSGVKTGDDSKIGEIPDGH